MKTSNVFSRWMLAAVVAGLLVSTAHADREWNLFDNGNPDSGDFGVAEHWDPVGIPDADDWVVFNNEATDAYTVTLEGETNRTIKGMSLQKDNVILDLNGNELTMPDLDMVGDVRPPNFIMGTDSGPTTLVIQDGTTPTGDGHFKASFAEIVNGSTMTVRNGTTFEFTNTLAHNVNGRSILSDATINISDGGEWITRFMHVLDTTINVLDGGVFRPLSTTHYGRGGVRGGAVVVNVDPGGQIIGAGIETGRDDDVTFNIRGSVLSSGSLVLGRRVGEQTVNITEGGTWSVDGGNLSLSVREQDNRHISGYVTVAGDDGNGNASRLEVSGNVTLGSLVIGTFNQVNQPPADERAWLTVSNGGEVSTGGELGIRYMGRLTIDQGDVEAGSLAIGAHQTAEDETKLYGEYMLTLYGDMEGGPAPLRVTGAANIGEGELDFSFTLDENYTPVIGHTFTIMSYGTLNTDHYFLGMQPNSTVTFEEHSAMWELDYGTGTDSAITLTVIPEPHTLGLLLAAGALIALRRRTGKRG